LILDYKYYNSISIIAESIAEISSDDSKPTPTQVESAPFATTAKWPRRHLINISKNIEPEKCSSSEMLQMSFGKGRREKEYGAVIGRGRR